MSRKTSPKILVIFAGFDILTGCVSIFLKEKGDYYDF